MMLARTDQSLTEVTTVTERAQSLAVSRSSLYYQPKLPTKDQTLKTHIEAVLAEHPSYGHRRIALELGLNRKRILRVMKLFKLKPYRRRAKFPSKPDDQHKPPSGRHNLIKYFCPIRPNVVWAVDFTYMWFGGRFIYLATVIDIHTRKIIGWHLSHYHDRFLVVAALTQAMTKTKTMPAYHHSDQGSEYESDEYQAILKQNNIQISMSRKSSPWENSFQESFYSQFKVDLGHIDRFPTVGELTEAINYQIHYYNTKRIHLSLKMSPAKFETNYQTRTNLLTIAKY